MLKHSAQCYPLKVVQCAWRPSLLPSCIQMWSVSFWPYLSTLSFPMSIHRCVYLQIPYVNLQMCSKSCFHKLYSVYPSHPFQCVCLSLCVCICVKGSNTLFTENKQHPGLRETLVRCIHRCLCAACVVHQDAQLTDIKSHAEPSKQSRLCLFGISRWRRAWSL
jgi:hypothetical protein